MAQKAGDTARIRHDDEKSQEVVKRAMQLFYVSHISHTNMPQAARRDVRLRSRKESRE